MNIRDSFGKTTILLACTSALLSVVGCGTEQGGHAARANQSAGTHDPAISATQRAYEEAQSLESSIMFDELRPDILGYDTYGDW